MIPFTPDERRAQFAPSQNVGGPVDPDILDIIGERPQPTMAQQVEYEVPEPRPIDPDVIDIVNKNQGPMMASLMGASRVNPDQAAEAKRLGSQIGVGQDIALRNLEDVRKRAFMADIQRRDIARSNPVLAGFLSDPTFANEASDDIEPLSRFERAMDYIADLPSEFGAGFRTGQVLVEAGMLGSTAQLRGRATEDEIQKWNQYQQELQTLSGDAGLWRQFGEYVGQYTRAGEEAVKGGVTGGVAGAGAALLAGQLGPQVFLPEEIVTVPAATLFGVGAGIASSLATTSARTMAGNNYMKNIESGMDPDVARVTALGVGVIGGALELFGMKLVAAPFKGLWSKVVSDAANDALVQPTVAKAVANAGLQYSKAVGGEIGTEVSQQITEIAFDEIAGYASDPNFESRFATPEGRLGIREELKDIIVRTALGMSVLGGIGPGANLYVDTRRAGKAVRSQQAIQSVIESVNAANLKRRDPDALEAFGNAALRETPAFIRGDTLRGILDANEVSNAEIDAIVPGLSVKIQEAVNADNFVSIPLAQFGVRLAGTKIGDAMVPHLTVDPTAMTPAELEAFNANVQEFTALAAAEYEAKTQTESAFVQEADQVATTMRERLIAAGRDPALAEVESLVHQAFVVTQAARQGKTPAQFEAESGLREIVGAEMPAAPLEQAARINTEYTAAVERGDMEAAQRMVDQVAKASGYNETGYHGLGEGVLEGQTFDPARKGKRTQAPSARMGFFFASRATAQTYAAQMPVEKELRDISRAARRVAKEFITSIPKKYRDQIDLSLLEEQLDRGDQAFMPDDETMPLDIEEPGQFVGLVIDDLYDQFPELIEDVLGVWPEESKARAQWAKDARKKYLGTIDPDLERFLRESRGQAPALINAKLRMQNPLIVDFEGKESRPESYANVISRAKKAGHDSVIIRNTYDTMRGEPVLDDIKVVFSPEQIKSADPVTRDEAGNIVPLSRRFDITSPRIFEQAAMATRVPTAVKPLEDALNDVLLADFPTFLRDEKFVAKNLAKFKELNAPIRIDPNATDQQQLEQIIEHMTSNLLWLHDAMDPAIRERARMWYVGGRRLVDWLAERHGMSPMGAATVFAVLSPQKNWYENVGLGIRITDIVATQGAATMDAEMQDAYLNSLRKAQTKLDGQLAKHDEAKPKRGKKAITDWEAKRADLAKEAKAAGDKVAEAQGNIDSIGNRTLAELLRDRDFFLAAIMVRWFDQTKNDRTYPVISPEGGVGSPMLTDAGTPASIRYGSYNEVAKAIAAYVDGRAENVHYLIGGEHKVRNFYNNLFNPEDPRFATIDTHAIAAAYLMPLAGTDKLVQHGLGGGVGNAMFGMGGGYAVFYEAYRRAAEARGIQPREMQSITWEAIRGMFEAAMKGGLKAPVAATWKRYVDGEIDMDAARADVMQRAGGITTPSWVALPTDMQPAAGYEGVSRTAADEQAKRIAAQPTAASVMFEVAPDPADAALVQRWEALSPQQRQAISVRVAEDMIPRILREYGVAADMVMQIGGWEGATNVGFALRMPPGPLVRQIAQSVGYALSQQAVFTLSATEFQGSDRADIVVVKLQPGTTVEQIGDLYERKLYPLGIQGHATVQDSMIISLDPGVDGAILADTIAAAVAGDGRIVEITHATGWRSLDETRITDEAARAADEGRRAEGAAGRRRVDAYRREATRLVSEYIGTGILEQAARGPARGGYDPSRLKILFGKGADFTTGAHELTHYYVDYYTKQAIAGTAAPQMLADLDIMFKFMGVEGATPEERLAAFNAMPFETSRPLIETITYNAEIYLFEGKAPSLELAGVFDRMLAFFRRAYKSIADFVTQQREIYRAEFGRELPELSDELRQVFDRMLADERQIKQAQAVAQMRGQFTVKPEGMDDAEWAAYQAMAGEATNEAIKDMTKASLRQMEWLSRARSRIIKDMQARHTAQRKEVRERVQREVQQEPLYRAMAFLRRGQVVAPDGTVTEAEGVHRIDRVLAAEFAPTVDLVRLGGRFGVLQDDGLHPDIVAEMFGYPAGATLLQDLADAKPMREVVEDRTDAEMLRLYGEMNTPAAREQEIQKALHNEARARLVGVELRFMGKIQQPVRVLLEAARQAAQQAIGRRIVREIRPSEFVAAEAKASREVTAAMQENKPDVAVRAKRAQLLNNQLAKAALQARDEIDTGVRYLRRVLRDDNRKRMGADVADQIASLLDRFNIAPMTADEARRVGTLAEFLATLEDRGLVPDIAEAIGMRDTRIPYKNMTVTEFRDLVDAVKQLEYIGKNERKILLAKEKAEFESVRDQIVASVIENAGDRKANARTATTNIGRAVTAMKGFAAAHLKAASIVRILDGGKDGGPLWNYLIRSANEAGDSETSMRAEATADLTKILEPVFRAGKLGGKGVFFPTINRSLNREARLVVALNMGNAGNMQRLLDGEGWSIETVMPVLQSLTEDELNTVQQIWDYFEKYRPMIGQKERRLYGKEPAWVDPQPLVVRSADGKTITLRGGYYPIKYDPKASMRAETMSEAEEAKRDLAGAYTTATTRRSFTKARVRKVEGRPLLYTLAGMYGGINDVIHDLTWHEWLITANRLMRSNSFDDAVRNRYGPEYVAQLKNWIKDVAAGERGVQNEAEMALNFLRQGISSAGLGFNVVSAIMQITGFNQSIVRVGAKWIGRGIAYTVTNPMLAMQEVNEKSEFMRNRSRTQFRELNEIRNMVQGQSVAMRRVQMGTYFLMMRMQRMVDVPTWHGAYEKAMHEGRDEATAIALADQAVIDSQGGGMVKDLARVERGGPAVKLFTVFYGYMNTVYSMAAVQTMTNKNKGRLAADYAMLFVVPVVLSYMLKQALIPRKGDEEEEWDMGKIGRELAAEQLSYLMGTMVIAREFGEVGKMIFGVEGPRMGYGGPAGLRAIGETYQFATQASQGEFDRAFRKSAVNMIGAFTGLPSAQVNRTLDGLEALYEGETENVLAPLTGAKKR